MAESAISVSLRSAPDLLSVLGDAALAIAPRPPTRFSASTPRISRRKRPKNGTLFQHIRDSHFWVFAQDMPCSFVCFVRTSAPCPKLADSAPTDVRAQVPRTHNRPDCQADRAPRRLLSRRELILWLLREALPTRARSLRWCQRGQQPCCSSCRQRWATKRRRSSELRQILGSSRLTRGHCGHAVVSPPANPASSNDCPRGSSGTSQVGCAAGVSLRGGGGSRTCGAGCRSSCGPGPRGAFPARRGGRSGVHPLQRVYT